MTNPISFLKTKYANIISDKHFGEIFTGSAKVFGAKVAVDKKHLKPFNNSLDLPLLKYTLTGHCTTRVM